MTYPNAQPGQRVQIPAKAQNELYAMLARGRVPGVGSGSQSAPSPYYTRIPGFNPGDEYIPAFGVARAVDSAIDPSEQLGQFLARPCMVIEPASDENAAAPLVIATNRIEADSTGLVAIAGVIQTRINVTDADHQYAEPSTSTAWLLDSADAGLPVLWKESGTGTKWAIVQLGSLGTSSASGRVRVQSASASGVAGWDTLTYDLELLDSLDGSGDPIVVSDVGTNPADDDHRVSPLVEYGRSTTDQVTVAPDGSFGRVTSYPKSGGGTIRIFELFRERMAPYGCGE